MLKRVFGWAKGRKQQKDFASVPVPSEIQDIKVPVITLEKYPVIISRAVGIVEKVSEVVAKRAGKSTEEVLEELTVSSLLQHLPVVLEVASAEFFSLTAFILDVEEDKVRKLGLNDFVKLGRATYENNEFAEVETQVRNFIQSLAAKKRQKSQGK